MTFGHMVGPGQIIIKDHRVLKAILEKRYSPLLIQMVYDLAKEHGCVVTSAYRENDEGVHGHMRGIDCRSWCYPDATAWRIVEEINKRWEYDRKRHKLKCAQVHKTKNGAMHIHLQVHPNTRRHAV